MNNKYLDELGVTPPWEWCKGDKRQYQWLKEFERHGFDSRDTWSLDFTILCLLYPRLKMYKEATGEVVNLDFHKFEYKGEVLTLYQVIDKILELWEWKLKDIPRTNEEYEKFNESWDLLKLIYCKLWW